MVSWTTSELIVARQVTAVGRSRAYLGGAQVPAPVCARVTEALIAIHGQSEQVRLTAADRQRTLLDRFAGETVASVLAPYARVRTPSAEPRRPSWSGCGPRRRAERGRSTCCGSA